MDHLGIDVGYDWLRQKLETTEFGTTFSNIERLGDELSIFVDIGKHGDFELFRPRLELGLPIIVGVSTFGWPHWNDERTDHAVVVIGFDDKNVYIHDPFFPDAPIEIDITSFLIGWIEGNSMYAVIGLTSPD